MRSRFGLLLSLGAFVLLACATTVQPQSANPYQAAQQQTQNRENQAPAGVNVTLPAALAQGVNRRADGQCYTVCAPGTACNESTGLCDRMPCGGRCGPGEVCERRGFSERCVDDTRLIVNPGFGGSSTGGRDGGSR